MQSNPTRTLHVLHTGDANLGIHLVTTKPQRRSFLSLCAYRAAVIATGLLLVITIL